ncbi:hypothetical protein MTP99_012361 [Tenebrio molitor]|nr:hypothetical protein MTP99_012361 [Tenebrio molitor]
METIKDVGSAFLCGFYDGFKGFFVAYNLDDDFHQRRSRISPAHSNSPIRRKYLELKEQTPVKKTPKQKDTVKYNIQQCLFLGILTYIEIHWIYFIGYGLPLALTTQVFNYWIIKACIFSILFPFYIVGANEATPKMVEFCAHIKFFSPVVTISNSIFSVLRRNNKLSGQRNLTQPRR